MELNRHSRNIWIINAAFALWLICEIVFAYSILSRLAFILFLGVVLLVTQRIHFSYMWIWYGIFALWAVVGIWQGHAIEENLAKSMARTVFLNVAFLCVFVGYCRYIGSIEKVLNIYKWTTFAFCIPSFVGAIVAILSGDRLLILGINANVVAMQAAYGVLIFINDLSQKDRQQRRVYEWLVIAFMLLTTFLTGSRKGLLIPVIGVYVLICCRKPRRFFWYTLLIAAVSAIVLTLLLKVDALYRLIGYRIEPLLQYIRGESFEEASMESRLDYIRLGWEETKRSPVFGRGLDCFRTLRYAYETYSHCNFIEILFSTGWVGLILYYIPYLNALRWAPRALRCNRTQAAMMLSLLIPYIVCEYFSVTYFSRVSLIIPAMVMCVLRKDGWQNEPETAD